MKPEKAPPFSTNEKLTNVIDSEVSTLYFYNSVVVGVGKEGVTLSYATGISLLTSVLKTFKLKPWVYITYRINSYAVQPTDYKYINAVPNLKGIAIVLPDNSISENTALESHFIKKPFKIFQTIDEAFLWANNLL